MSRLPADLDAIVRDEIGSGETVEWQAQPDAVRALKKAFGLWIFGVPVTFLTVSLTALVVDGITDWSSYELVWPLLPLSGLVFGLPLLLAPLLEWRRVRRTLYAITDRRAILFESTGGRTISVRSLEPRDVREARREERPDGSGSLAFVGTHQPRDPDTPLKFADIPDVSAAHDAIAFLANTSGWTEDEREGDLLNDVTDRVDSDRRLRS